MSKRNKKPWPTKEAMIQVYEKNLWGGKKGEFYSGEGSHNEELVEPYVKVVKEFLKSLSIEVVVVDLGCGDFNIGKKLVDYTSFYTAVDIVPGLIIRNRNKYNSEKLDFLNLDIAEDELPDGDIVILRQVLQHLSNREIGKILAKLHKYKFLILTEHLPLGEFIPNMDIISGQGNRLKHNSGLDITQSPFDFKFEKITELLSLKSGRDIIKTFLFEL